MFAVIRCYVPAPIYSQTQENQADNGGTPTDQDIVQFEELWVAKDSDEEISKSYLDNYKPYVPEKSEQSYNTSAVYSYEDWLLPGGEVDEIAIDTADNIYIVGYVNGTLPGQIPLGSSDAFISKFSTTGTEIWTRQFGTSKSDFANGVALDEWGNAYVTGSMSYPGSDAFICKYDTGGNELWRRQFGAFGTESGNGIAVDGAGNAYIIGTIYTFLYGSLTL